MTHLYPPFTEKKNTELLRGQFLDESGAVLVMDIALGQFSEFEEFSPQETLNLRSPISKSHLPISSAFHLSRSLSSLTKHSQNWDFDSHLGSWPQPFHIDCGPSRKCYNLRDTDAVTFSIVSGPSLNPILPHCYPIIVSPCQ